MTFKVGDILEIHSRTGEISKPLPCRVAATDVKGEYPILVLYEASGQASQAWFFTSDGFSSVRKSWYLALPAKKFAANVYFWTRRGGKKVIFVSDTYPADQLPEPVSSPDMVFIQRIDWEG